jgi:hypothetical protein
VPVAGVLKKKKGQWYMVQPLLPKATAEAMHTCKFKIPSVQEECIMTSVIMIEINFKIFFTYKYIKILFFIFIINTLK